MMSKHGITTLVSALALTARSSAWAQEFQPGNELDPERDQAPSPGVVRAPRKAFEIGVVGGYTQPFGNIANRRVIGDQVDAGGAIGLDLGYRFNPRWSIGFTSQYHDSGAVGAMDSFTDFRGIATGVQGTFHLAPFGRVDPYLTLGTGYRLLWRSSDVVGTPSLLTHGLQIGKALVGIDFRLSENFALGPVAGADVNVFLWDNPEGAVGNEPIVAGDRRPNTFVFAGLAARFDVGGTRIPRVPMVARTSTIDATPMEQPTPAAGPPAPRTAPPARPATSMINVNQDLLSRCGITQTHAFFEFDSADVTVKHGSTLGQLATCVSTGALAGRKLQIVGHADPRGTDEYNAALGRSRAQSVAEFLGSHGLGAGSIQVTSQGEREATGVNEQGWAYDRRVDIQLVP